MPDDATPETGQVPAPEQGQVPTGTPPQEGTPPAGQEPPGESAEIRSLRQEAAKYRRDARDAQERLKALEDAALSEEQRREQALATATAERDELKTRLASTTLRAEVITRAAAKGIVDPEAAQLLLGTAIDVDSPTFADDLDAALDALLVKRPYLKAAAAGDPPTPKDPPNLPPSNPPKPSVTKELTREDLKGLSRSQIEALPQDVLRAAMNRT